MTAIKKPLTFDEMLALHEASDDGYITVEVLVDFNAVLSYSLEDYVDFLCELVGSYYLMDVGYKITGFAGDDTLVVEVTADATQAIANGQ